METLLDLEIVSTTRLGDLAAAARAQPQQKVSGGRGGLRHRIFIWRHATGIATPLKNQQKEALD